MIQRYVAGVLLIASCAFATPVFAQFSITFDQPLTLSLSSTYPEAGETIRLSIQSYALNLNDANIVWRANGAIIAQGVGLTEAAVVAGALGSRTDIQVSASGAEGVAQATATILPTEMDLLWESEAFTPPFFQGRALPGASSAVRLQAIPRFRTASGTLVPTNSITYSWYQDDRFLANLSGRGKSSVQLTGPALFDTDTIRVEARFGDIASVRSVILNSNDSSISLYELHPLFGILFHRSLEGSVLTTETEQKLAAVPYFANVAAADATSLIYEWRVNNIDITADPKERNLLTLTSNGYTGPLNIELTVSSLSDIVMQARGAWEIVFGQTSAAFVTTNPFGSN